MAKVMVSLPDELLEQIDAEAERRAMTRSGLLAAAARRELSRATPAQMDAAVEAVRAIFAKNGDSFDAAELIRVEREERDARDRRR